MKDPTAFESKYLKEAIETYLKFTEQPSLEAKHHGAELMLEIAEFIGHPNEPNPYGKIIPTFKPEVQRIIRMMGGPHGHTILAALKARKENE